MKKSIQVMLVEDSPEFRDAVKLVLDETPDIELIAEFGTSEIALRTLRDPGYLLIPNVMLLDLRLPGISGLDAIPQIRECLPETKIIILTQSNNEKDVLRAISLGASGYLLKSATLDKLTESIRTVMNGGASLDAGVARFILESLKTRLPSADEESILSTRELEILTLLAAGLVKKEIASRLGISYATVDTHVGHIYLKLDVTNAPAAVNKAHRLSLFDPDT